MTSQFALTTLNLPMVHRHSIGFERMFDELHRNFANSRTNDNYPPYSIIRTGDTSYRIDVAVAGFAETEIDIEVKDSVLTVTGKKITPETDITVEYIHKGISTKQFERSFSLADYVEVQSAKVINGILEISLEQIIPEEKKAKKIPIAFNA
jgi:molecular chaperone IbpA